jgi:hypothetical protein
VKSTKDKNETLDNMIGTMKTCEEILKLKNQKKSKPKESKTNRKGG